MNNEATPELPDSTFAALSRIVLGEEPLDAILERVMRLAVEVLPLECEASITLVRSDGPTTGGRSGTIPRHSKGGGSTRCAQMGPR